MEFQGIPAQLSVPGEAEIIPGEDLHCVQNACYPMEAKECAKFPPCRELFLEMLSRSNDTTPPVLWCHSVFTAYFYHGIE